MIKHSKLLRPGRTDQGRGWKSGKTTLLAILLARLKDGGELLGLPVRPAKALVLSEENANLWHGRRQRLDFGEQPGLISQPCNNARGKNMADES